MRLMLHLLCVLLLSRVHLKVSARRMHSGSIIRTFLFCASVVSLGRSRCGKKFAQCCTFCKPRCAPHSPTNHLLKLSQASCVLKNRASSAIRSLMTKTLFCSSLKSNLAGKHIGSLIFLSHGFCFASELCLF